MPQAFFAFTAKHLLNTIFFALDLVLLVLFVLLPEDLKPLAFFGGIIIQGSLFAGILVMHHQETLKTARLIEKALERLPGIKYSENSSKDALTEALDSLLEEHQKFFEVSEANMKHSYNISESLKDSIHGNSKITGQIKALREETENLNSAVIQSSAAINQISQSIGSFSSQINSQTQAVSHTSSSLEEISASIANINETAGSKRKKSEELLGLTEKGARQQGATNHIVDQVSAKIDSIQGVIEIINNIASQTNLLAMNAAIEAAHAGDAGRGFSVVADEIRKLSENTSVNAKQINLDLKEMLDGVAQIRKSNVLGTGYLQEIQKETGAMVSAYSEIQASTQELKLGSDDILRAMGDLSGIASQLNRGFKEVEQSAQEINDAILSLKEGSQRTKQDIYAIADSAYLINQLFQNITVQKIREEKSKESLNQSYAQIMNRECINTPLIMMQHLLWVLKCRSVLDDKLDIPLKELTDHTTCDLGKWIQSPQSRPFHQESFYKGLLKNHEALHALVHKLIEDKARISRSELEKGFVSLVDLSEKILEDLSKIHVACHGKALES